MGRPTVYGKELRVNTKNKCIGINLGYNFYCEHEGDTIDIVQSCNCDDLREIRLMSSSPIKYRKELSKLKKQRKVNEELISRWDNTPFKNHVFMPNVNTMLRMIVIDNSEIRNEYSTFLLNDGHYYLLSIGNGFTSKDWDRKFGKKKTVSEKDIFYMQDYQDLYRIWGYTFNNGYSLVQRGNFGASWSIHSNYLIVVLPAEQKSYLEDIQSALKAGVLACVQQDLNVFTDRGCCLINLEAVYF